MYNYWKHKSRRFFRGLLPRSLGKSNPEVRNRPNVFPKSLDGDKICQIKNKSRLSKETLYSKQLLQEEGMGL